MSRASSNHKNMASINYNLKEKTSNFFVEVLLQILETIPNVALIIV